MKTSRLMLVVLFLLLVSLWGVSCSSSSTPETLPPATDTPAISSTPVPVEDTPAPVIGKVVLIAPDPASPQAISAQALLSELSAAASLNFETRPSLSTADITPEWKLVVLLNLDENLSSALGAAPHVQFLVISPYDLGMTGNLSVIRVQPEQTSFLAGYVTTLVATDWRAAGFFTTDEPVGTVLEEGFRNGSGYFCGSCVPYYAPVIRFPVTARINPASDQASREAIVEQARLNLIYAAYVSPEVSTNELLTYLAQQGIILVGGASPPEELRSAWAATITQDAIGPIRSIFSDLIAGQGGKVVYAQVMVSDINEAYITPGKLRLVMETVEKLKEGLINPSTVPLQ